MEDLFSVYPITYTILYYCNLCFFCIKNLKQCGQRKIWGLCSNCSTVILCVVFERKGHQSSVLMFGPSEKTFVDCYNHSIQTVEINNPTSASGNRMELANSKIFRNTERVLFSLCGKNVVIDFLHKKTAFFLFSLPLSFFLPGWETKG